MEKTLLIHIGMPKTGTTTLQKFLFANKERLRQYGWCYPILKDGNIGFQESVGVESCGNGYYIFEDWTSNTLRSEWDHGMKVALRYLQNQNVIISSEHCYSNIEKFLADIKEKYENIKVVVYLRRQDREMESLYNQLIKNGDEYNEFKRFICLNNLPEHFLDYGLKLDAVGQVIGKENIIVRVYEKQQLVGNDIVIDFLSVLGIAFREKEWESCAPRNMSLKGNYLEINRLINSVRAVNHICDSKDEVHTVKSMQHDFCSVCAGLSDSFSRDLGDRVFFAKNERKEFLNKFSSDNERIAREYLHREDGILFYDELPDDTLYETDQHNSFEADIIRVFTRMLYLQDQKIRNTIIRTSVWTLGRMLMKDVLKQRKGRETILFGAGYNCKKLFDSIQNISVAMIVDNDISKQNASVNGVSVKYAKDIMDWQKYFVIVTCEKSDAVEEQLRGYGLNKEEDYILMNEYGL